VLIYVHVPFCARRCSYCDFAIAVRREVPSDLFAGLIAREWERRQNLAWWDAAPDVETVYFGGGTPSRLDPAALGRILESFAGRRTLVSGAEITLEANPEDVTAERAAAWRAAGINRVSLGAQSFDRGTLEWMHRLHTAGQTELAARLLRRAGLGNLSLDLIYGVPEFLGRQ
jgi:oxygen-independent coproporphyrinogen III oxidase